MDPRILTLAMKAQAEFSKARRMDDRHGVSGQFCVNDMLDILGRELDAARDRRETNTKGRR